MIKYTQHSFAGGQLDRDLMGRQDLAKYFTGSTTLENFVVKRQGSLAKRRGTELVADLEGLFRDSDGKVTSATIAAAITIPFVYTREGGYTLLIATPDDGSGLAGGDTAQCFVLSAQGILLARTRKRADGTTAGTEHVWDTHANLPDETESATEIDEASGIPVDVSYTISYAPFALALPYKTADLEGLTNTQSGDTLFLAHKGYPFARLVKGLGDADWTYEAINFATMGNAARLYPPTLYCEKKNEPEGDETAAEKAVSYVATYVKDGVESAPSTAVQVTYRLPWANTFQIEITLDKGANAEPPDYYNIYKKSNGGYGFIGNTMTILQNATLNDFAPSSYDSRLKPLYDQLIRSTSIVNPYNYAIVDTLPKLFSGIDEDRITGGAWTEDARPNSPIAFNFPAGTLATGVLVRLDCFVCSGNPMAWKGLRRHWYSEIRRTQGKSLRCTITVTNGTTTKTFSKTLAMPAYDPTDWISHDAGYMELDARPEMLPDDWPRSVDFDFADDILADPAFSDGSAWISSIQLGACAGADGTLASDGLYEPLVVSQLCLRGKSKTDNVFYDDYITPDVSITPPQTEPHFNRTNDYPGCAAIYEQRLVLAATNRQPFTIWMSCVGDLYNFNTHDSLREDDAIEATIPATEFPEINHMVMNKDLLIFCDNGEWVVAPVTGNTLSYKTLAIKLQSKIGCSKRLYPIIVGDEVVFSEATERTLRASRYDFTSDGYQSVDLSVLSQDIFEGNPIVDMDYKQHPDSQIVCVLQDGTLATLSYMREHELAAWSVHTLGGGLKAIGVSSDKALHDGTTDTYLLAEREEAGGERLFVLRIREDVKPDTVRKAICLDAIEWVTATNRTAIPDGKVAVDVLTGERVDYVVPGRDYAIGYPFSATFRSIRPEAQGEQTIQFELKNATNAEIRLLDASPVRVVPTALEQAPENQWMDAGPQVAPDAEGNLALGESLVLVNLAGVAAEDGALTLVSETHWPLKLLSFSVNYEFDPQHINQQG